MRYKLREDVILEKVDTIYLLVALRSAWGECPFAIHMAPTLALIWEQFKVGQKKEEIIHSLINSKNMPEQQAEKVFESFMRNVRKYNYLIEEKEQ